MSHFDPFSKRSRKDRESLSACALAQPCFLQRPGHGAFPAMGKKGKKTKKQLEDELAKQQEDQRKQDEAVRHVYGVLRRSQKR